MTPLKEKNANGNWKQKIKKDLSQEKWKQDAKKNFGRSQSALEQKKETTGESVQFPGLDGEALSFVDTNDFLLSSLFLLNDYDKGKEEKKKWTFPVQKTRPRKSTWKLLTAFVINYFYQEAIS